MFLLGNGELFCSYSETGSCFVPTRKRGAVLFLLKSRELFWCMLNPTAARLGYLVYSHTEAGGCFAPTLKQGADFFPLGKRELFWCVLLCPTPARHWELFCSYSEAGRCFGACYVLKNRELDHLVWVPTQKQGAVLFLHRKRKLLCSYSDTGNCFGVYCCVHCCKPRQFTQIQGLGAGLLLHRNRVLFWCVLYPTASNLDNFSFLLHRYNDWELVCYCTETGCCFGVCYIPLLQT